MPKFGLGLWPRFRTNQVCDNWTTLNSRVSPWISDQIESSLWLICLRWFLLEVAALGSFKSSPSGLWMNNSFIIHSNWIMQQRWVVPISIKLMILSDWVSVSGSVFGFDWLIWPNRGAAWICLLTDRPRTRWIIEPNGNGTRATAMDIDRIGQVSVGVLTQNSFYIGSFAPLAAPDAGHPHWISESDSSVLGSFGAEMSVCPSVFFFLFFFCYYLNYPTLKLGEPNGIQLFRSVFKSHWSPRDVEMPRDG